MGSGSSSNTSSSSESDDESSEYDNLNEDNNKDTNDASSEDTSSSSTDLDLNHLFEHSMLRDAAAKIKDDIPETVVQQHHGHLLRWLEERLQRHETTISLSQFCDVLMNRAVGREECMQAFEQFDVDGDGQADVEATLDALKSSNGANLKGELSHVIRSLQACSLSPGLLDVYSTEQARVPQHGKRIMKYILRNRAPSTSLPFASLDGFNNSTGMRLTVLKHHFEVRQKQTARRESTETDGGEVKVISKCYKSIQVSTNNRHVQRLTDGDSNTFWQSDGAARSHWIRLRLKSGVSLKHLSIEVARQDQSYMPQHVIVSTGRSLSSMQDIRDIRIPNHMTGEMVLLENVHITNPYIQINIRRCHSDGCDARIHGIKALGSRLVQPSEIGVKDASAVWYLSVLASTATASIPTAPHLRHAILIHTKTALSHMPPLSLSHASCSRNSFLSPHVMDEMETFLNTIARDECGNVDLEGTQILLELALARGSCLSVLKALQCMQGHIGSHLATCNLLRSLEVVTEKILKKYGNVLSINLAGCDGGQKDDSSIPDNVLSDNWNTQVYNSSKTLVNMVFTGESLFQITKVRIKVSHGGNGAKCGYVFVYNDEDGFNLERHVNRFKEYDTWNAAQYNIMHGLRAASIGGNPDNPVAYFNLEDDWDEVELVLDRCYVGKYMLIKFLKPRKETAESLGIVGVRCYGHNRQLSPIDLIQLNSVCSLPLDREDPVPLHVTFTRVVHFLVHIARDMNAIRKHDNGGKCPSLDMQDISMELLKQVYNRIAKDDDEWGYARVLMLQLLHYSFPALVKQVEKANKQAEKKAAMVANASQHGLPPIASVTKDKSPCTQEMFVHLCHIVNTSTQEGDKPAEKTTSHSNSQLLLMAARIAILDGAAVFFPDKHARKQELFNMMSTVDDDGQSSGGLVFQSLCRYYSAVDPSGLLDLPVIPTINNRQEEKNQQGQFDTSQVLSVMETMLSVVFKEFKERLSGGDTPSDMTPSSCSYICKLLCSLQTSLILWCRQLLQDESTSPEHIEIAQNLLVKYTRLYCTKTQDALMLLCQHHKECDVMSQMAHSFVATAFRQMVLCLTLLSQNRLPHLELAQQLVQVYKQVGQLEHTMGDTFYQGGSRPSSKEKELVVLRTWNVESLHNYENNQHVTQILTCPGAELFHLEFDPMCCTERRYDYLEFTDSRGVKTRYDQKVGTEKWPVSVTFKSGHRLQFLFHSDSSNNEWGYKFTVTAKGSPDVSLSWLYDLQLSVAKLIGKLLSTALNPGVPSNPTGSQQPTDNTAEVTEQDSMAILAKGELWNTLFRSGRSTKTFTRSLSGIHAAEPTNSALHDFLVSVSEGEIGKATRYITRCREHCQAPSVGGAIVESAINSVFAALLWHSQQLRGEVSAYLKNTEDAPLSDGMIQAFRTAEGLRPLMIDLRQKGMAKDEKKAAADQDSKNRRKSEGQEEGKGQDEGKDHDEEKGQDEVKSQEKGKGQDEGKDHDERKVQEEIKGQDEVQDHDEGKGKNKDNGQEKKAKAQDGDKGLDEGRCPDEGKGPNEVTGDIDDDAKTSSEETKETDKNEADTKLIACRDKARFLLTFAGLCKPDKTEHGRHWLVRRPSHYNRAVSQEMLPRQKSLERSVSLQGTSSDDQGSILSTFPEFKLVLDYVKNHHLTVDSVLDLLTERQKRASLIADVYHFACEFLECSLGKPKIFLPVCVQFLREMLSCTQVAPMHYASGLDGCGLELENKLRKAYYMLVQKVVETINNFNVDLLSGSDLQAYECIQACLLHLLDIDWQPYDWQFLDEINAPSLLLTIAKRSVSLRDMSVSETSTEKQLEVYKQCQDWLKKCEGEPRRFSHWFEDITKASMEERRAMHMFVARFCDQLDVQIKCDGCGTMLPGQRYRCLVCEDMDFCYSCYIGGVKPEGHKDEHPLVHLMYKCDSCHAFVVGTRIHCNVCDDFDLCYGCHHHNKFPSCHKSYHDIETVAMTTVTAGSMFSGMLKTYNHHHSWLLFASLALLFAGAVNQPGKHDISSNYIDIAMRLHQQSLDLVTDCLQLLTDDTETPMATAGKGRPEAIVFDGDMGGNWMDFETRFDRYIAEVHPDKTPAQIAYMLLILTGQEAIDKSKGFAYSPEVTDTDGQVVIQVAERKDNPDVLKQKFRELCGVETREMLARVGFNSRKQYATEDVESYLRALRYVAKPCNYMAYTDERILDQLINGLRSDTLRDKLIFGVQDLTLTKAIHVCKDFEATQSRQLSATDRPDLKSNVHDFKEEQTNKDKQRVSIGETQDSDHNKTITMVTAEIPKDTTASDDTGSKAENATEMQDIRQTLSKMLTDKLEGGKESTVKADDVKETVDKGSFEQTATDKVQSLEVSADGAKDVAVKAGEPQSATKDSDKELVKEKPALEGATVTTEEDPDSNEAAVNEIPPAISLEGTDSSSIPGLDKSTSGIVVKEDEDEPQMLREAQLAIYPSIDAFNKAFVECSQERLLGLLTAMLLIDNDQESNQPMPSPSRKARVQGETFLPLLLSLTKQVRGQRNEPQHLAVALLGQVLCHSEPQEADHALMQVTNDSEQTSEAVEEASSGTKTARLLFSLGASCLERSGMDWAALMADVLQRLWACPSWQSVIAGHVSHMVQTLPDNFNQLPAIFALFVLAGFPEVLSLGSSVLYSEPSGDRSNVIVIKHYMEKSRAVIVDMKTRKRKLVKEYQLEVEEKCGQTLSTEQFASFVSIAVRILTDLKAGKEQTVEALWVLYLTLKALTTSLQNDSSSSQQLLDSGIIPLLVYMASKATQLSRQWILKDLEILSIKLYTREKTFGKTPVKSKRSKSADLTDPASDSDSMPWSDADSISIDSNLYEDTDSDDDSGSGYLTPDSGPTRTPPMPVHEDPQGPQGMDPLDGLDDKAKACFVVTNEAIRAPMSVLRAMYEQCGRSIKELVEEVQNCYQGDELVVNDEIRAKSMKWETKPTVEEKVGNEVESKAVDSGAVSRMPDEPSKQPSNKEIVALPEPTDGPLKLIATSEKDLKESYKKVLRSKSAELLKKELNTQGKAGSRDFLLKINTAMGILRARHLLAILLADWPKDSKKISASIFGCTEHSQLVSILDLLQKSVSKDVFQKVVETVVWNSDSDLLSPLSTSAVSFMHESSVNIQTKESLHNYKDDTKEEGRVCIAGATHLTIKFDEQCATEEGCDILVISSDQQQKHDRHVVSGTAGNWVDFEIPGDTLYYSFNSDSSNNDWGYKFIVIGNQLGRFETGYIIMSTVLRLPTMHQITPVDEVWKWLIQVACQQTSQHRLKVLQLLLQVLHIESSQQQAPLASADATITPTNGLIRPDLTLLKPLWILLNKMDGQQSSDSAAKCLPAVHRALTELFLMAEQQAQDWNIHEDYVIAMIDDQRLKQVAAQALKNIAAIALGMNIPNKASKAFEQIGLVKTANPKPK